MSVHTAGPWAARPTRSGKLWQVLTVDPGGPLICELRTSAADANLIAAAPDLLAALKLARTYVKATHAVIDGAVGEDNLISPDLTFIDAAIAAAEGHTP